MDEYDHDIILHGYLYLNMIQKRKKNGKSRWVKEIFLKREEKGAYHHLLQELRLKDRAGYFR